MGVEDQRMNALLTSSSAVLVSSSAAVRYDGKNGPSVDVQWSGLDFEASSTFWNYVHVFSLRSELL